jgi:dihydroorotate dehydrogenase electron transfer subunit
VNLRPARLATVEAVQNFFNVYSIIDLRVDLSEEPLPGQFFMIYSEDSEEIPMAAMDYEGGVLRIGNKAVGKSTRALLRLRCGDYLSVRGPYGSHFDTGGAEKVFMPVGGIGFTSIYLLVKKRREDGLESHVALFFRTSREIVLSRLFDPLSPRIEVFADDLGSDPSRVIKERLMDGSYDLVATNGPEGFVHKVWKLCEELSISSQCALARYVKCGVGLCGSCLIEGKDCSLRLCVDGPVFNSETLRRLEDFGRYRYDEAGRKVSL